MKEGKTHLSNSAQCTLAFAVTLGMRSIILMASPKLGAVANFGAEMRKSASATRKSDLGPSNTRLSHTLSEKVGEKSPPEKHGRNHRTHPMVRDSKTSGMWREKGGMDPPGPKPPSTNPGCCCCCLVFPPAPPTVEEEEEEVDTPAIKAHRRDTRAGSEAMMSSPMTL